jgi:uncharacterized protein (TIGR02444 family)
MSALLEPADCPDFWDWSLEVYRQKGVADTLLQLQDGCGADVNLVLWCIWAGKYYAELTEESVLSILEQTTHWAERVTVPLRDLRRQMKQMPTGLPEKDVENLRRRIKAAELESERLSQNALASATRAHAGPHRHARTTNAWHYNFSLYCREAGLLKATSDGAGGLNPPPQPDTLAKLYLRALKLIFPNEVVYF